MHVQGLKKDGFTLTDNIPSTRNGWLSELSFKWAEKDVLFAIRLAFSGKQIG